MLYLRVLFLPLIVLLQNKHTTLAENVENLIRAQPRISAHLELAPTLKVLKFNKRPGRQSSKYVIKVSGHNKVAGGLTLAYSQALTRSVYKKV